MKIGSLVVIKTLPPVNESVRPHIKWMPVQDENTIYTVRSIDKDHAGTELALLEEGVLAIEPLTGIEYGIRTEYLREVQPPEAVSISLLMKEVNEKELFTI